MTEDAGRPIEAVPPAGDTDDSPEPETDQPTPAGSPPRAEPLAGGPAAEAAGGELAGPPEPLVAARPRWLTAVLLAVIAVALVAIGGAVSTVTGIGRPYLPRTDSVDAGFARDMATHHEQAVHMAQVARDHSTDPSVRLIAYDIETGQIAQTGQLRGWLQSWGLSQQSSRPMTSWMGGATATHGHAASDGALMPGMATTTELTKLRSLSGRELDVYFLQLMIRHHQGGLPMARYAAEHARVGYVRDLATKVADAQTGEVALLERMLRERGGTPLQPPA